MNILLRFLNLWEQNASFVYSPQFLRHGRRRKYLPNPDVRVTMQADKDTKMLPVQAGKPFPA